MGLFTLTEDQRLIYHSEAVRLNTLLIGGVLEDYINKLSAGRVSAAKQLDALRLKRRLGKLNRLNNLKQKRQKDSPDPKRLNTNASQTM